MKIVSNILMVLVSLINRFFLFGLLLCRFVCISEFLKMIIEKFMMNVVSSENSGNILQFCYNGCILQFVEIISDFIEDWCMVGSSVLSVMMKNIILFSCCSDIFYFRCLNSVGVNFSVIMLIQMVIQIVVLNSIEFMLK